MKFITLLALLSALIPTISGSNADPLENERSLRTPSHLHGTAPATTVKKNNKQGQTLQEDPQERVLDGSVKARLDLTFGNNPKKIYFYILDIDSTGSRGNVVLYPSTDIVPKDGDKWQFEFDMLPGQNYRFVLLASDGFRGTFVLSIPAGSKQRLVLTKGPQRSMSKGQMEEYDFSLDRNTGELIDGDGKMVPPPQDMEPEGGNGGRPLDGRLRITFDDSPDDTIFYILDVDPTGEGNVLINGILYDKNTEVVYYGPDPRDKPPSPYEEREIPFPMEKGHNYKFALHSKSGRGFKGRFVITTVDGGRRNVLSQGPKSRARPFKDQEYNFSP